MVRTSCSHCRGPRVQSLVGELRSHKPQGKAKKKKKRKNLNSSFSLTPHPPNKSALGLISTFQNISKPSISCHLSGYAQSLFLVLLLPLLPRFDPFLQWQQGKCEPPALTPEWLPPWPCHSDLFPAGVMPACVCLWPPVFRLTELQPAVFSLPLAVFSYSLDFSSNALLREAFPDPHAPRLSGCLVFTI